MPRARLSPIGGFLSKQPQPRPNDERQAQRDPKPLGKKYNHLQRRRRFQRLFTPAHAKPNQGDRE